MKQAWARKLIAAVTWTLFWLAVAAAVQPSMLS